MIDYEKKISSQNGEDGIIEYLFNNIETTNKKFIEIGVGARGSGKENNTVRLSHNGWNGWWFDCDPINYIPASVQFQQKFITAENISNIFKDNNLPIEFDLLSIDIDGMDYWVRKALYEYMPRVIVMEYNGWYNSSEEWVASYFPNFIQKDKKHWGCSLKSFQILNNKLGYDLVYCEQRGVNAFFIRSDINPFGSKQSEEIYIQLEYARNK